MADERTVFERLDSIEVQNAEIIRLLSESLDKPQTTKQTPQESDSALVKRFLKGAKKSWMWFGTRLEFKRKRTIAIFSSLLLLVVGLVATIMATLNFGFYSTFTLFENIWMIFAVINIVHALKAQRDYEANALAAKSSTKYQRDSFGMILPTKEKGVYRVFRWLAIIAVVCNIITIWIKPSDFSVIATIFEILFLAAIVFEFFMNTFFFGGYSIIKVEGQSLVTKEKVVLVCPNGSRELILEEDFKKLMPDFYVE